LKLSPLLAQFLLANKHLNLAGLGRFILDEAGAIAFQQDITVKEDPELVTFIAERSGKMKSLIAADLDSNIELARQFLNIGKPYLFEGIGTLSKNKSGNFEFIPGNLTSTEKSKEGTNEGRDMTSTTENSFTDYEEMFSPRKPKGPATKKIVTWFVVIAGIGLAVYGGYLVYDRSKSKKIATSIAKQQEPVIEQKDSLPNAKDSIPEIKKPAVDSSGLYRFVVEKALRPRAFSRYAYLQKIKVNVKKDTKDSVLFNLFFVLPAAPADTARIRDSLQIRYSTRGRTIIELN
jgi:hypothetical protein